MKKILLPILLYFLITTILIVMNKNVTTIKYFPLSENESFLHTSTEIIPLTDHDNGIFIWKTSSVSSEPVYLRQDISLLYENGLFKGVLNVWKPSTPDLTLEKNIRVNKSSLLQTITFHHGEFHDDLKQFTSIQQMSHDHLYSNLTNNEWTTFRRPAVSSSNKPIYDKLNNTTNELVNENLNDITQHFNIDRDNYIDIPLVNLVQFNDQRLLDFPQKKSDQIIGQLWEGLYTQYITLLINKKDQKKPHVMPHILISKEKDHLLILFKIDQEYYQFIQKFPQ